MSEAETPWSSLASRVVRVVLARKDFSYSRLSEALASVGVNESERSLASRVSRGRIKLGLLLQILFVTGAKVPKLWDDALSGPGTWEQRARAVVVAELSRQPTVSINELAQRMVRLGADLTEKTLTSHLAQGTLSLPEFLRCLVALGSSSLERYVDYEDLVAAVQAKPAPPLA
ncbi:DUF6471 domain-containing protein [Ralstonia pseudosolanacearum]|uniref:DUF6471 domain-containing protein n=1 Tax=Ralstonia pseudosolanacearum TaxID=1310165 RepID=UPI000FDB55FF|nr:DUF6471 domain-containing protein [Ralstonia pseudosolanacearum]MCK4140500.1 hypothetical protein [Ralstonia pseudosolanacearum]UQY82408.1 hypothetical protein JNO62_16530 [Ralstonia pseudosolanacearum]